MKATSLIVLVAASFMSQAVRAEAVPSDLNSSRFQLVSTFISKLQSLADSGKLNDSVAVGEILEMSFFADTKEEEPQPADCTKPMAVESRQATRFRLMNESWYQPTSIGFTNLEVPSFAINPAFVVDESRPPTVQYSSYRLAYCDDPQIALRETTDTQLVFDNLPRFACISAKDIRSLLPKAELHEATDGYYFYYYSGNVNSNSGTHLRFSFRAFVSCSLDAKIEQSIREGLRYKKVDSEMTRCRNKAREEYRQTHSPASRSVSRDLDMKASYSEDILTSDQYMVKACGTFEEHYKQEQ